MICIEINSKYKKKHNSPANCLHRVTLEHDLTKSCHRAHVSFGEQHIYTHGNNNKTFELNTNLKKVEDFPGKRVFK